MKRIKKRKFKKKMLPIILGICLLSVIAITLIIIKLNEIDEEPKIVHNDVEVTLIDDLEVEINSEVNLLSFVKKIENGEIAMEEEMVDTSVLGEKKLVIKIKEDSGKIIDYKFEINVIDTTDPIIEAKDEISVMVGKYINLTDGVVVYDNSNEDIEVTINGEYDTKTVGNYNLEYYVEDSSGNSATYEFVLKVVSNPNNRTFKTSKGYDGKVIDGVTYIDGVLIANKTYSLPSNYGNGLTSETQNAFNKMNADASSLGLNLWISSGYRSYYDQKYIYNNYVAKDGQEEADTYSARAGHSEHQTGLAFDLNTIDESFTNTPEGIWVNDNCYKYGLIIRYPYGKDNITGYMHESWHLRYVGVELATILYNDGNWITLEEYFGIDSKYS